MLKIRSRAGRRARTPRARAGESPYASTRNSQLFMSAISSMQTECSMA